MHYNRIGNNPMRFDDKHSLIVCAIERTQSDYIINSVKEHKLFFRQSFFFIYRKNQSKLVHRKYLAYFKSNLYLPIPLRQLENSFLFSMLILADA